MSQQTIQKINIDALNHCDDTSVVIVAKRLNEVIEALNKVMNT